MKKTIVLLSLMTVASMTFADNSDSKTTLKLPSNSVACYGTVAGMCDSQWAPITHEQLVSNVAGEPSIVTSIHYFLTEMTRLFLNIRRWRWTTYKGCRNTSVVEYWA